MERARREWEGREWDVVTGYWVARRRAAAPHRDSIDILTMLLMRVRSDDGDDNGNVRMGMNVDVEAICVPKSKVI